MQAKLMVLILSVFSLTNLARASSEPAFIDYDKLDLTVTIKALRSGNQSPSGVNSYYFKLIADALPILKEELKKTTADRQKIERETGEFGQLEIKSLKNWIPDRKPNPLFSKALSGDLIRELAAETMHKFKVAEDGVTIICRIEMYERSKKWGFWGEEIKVGEVTFPIIPETLPHGTLVENRNLTIRDDTGTLVQLAVVFKSLEVKPVETLATEKKAPNPK